MPKSIISKLPGVIPPNIATGIPNTTHILKILLPIILPIADAVSPITPPYCPPNLPALEFINLL